jgi:hypothetical protein
MEAEIAYLIHQEFRRFALADALKWLADVSQEDAEAIWRALENTTAPKPFDGLTADQLRLLQVLAMLGYNTALLRLARSGAHEPKAGATSAAVTPRRPSGTRRRRRRSRSPAAVEGPR